MKKIREHGENQRIWRKLVKMEEPREHAERTQTTWRKPGEHGENWRT